MLLGDIDTNGSLNAQMIHQFTDRIRGKMIIQVNLMLRQTFGCVSNHILIPVLFSQMGIP